MASKAASTIIGPSATALTDALEAVAADELQVVAEYDPESYEILYVADWIVEEYGGEDEIEAELDAAFDYFHLDFLERDLLDELLWLGEVGTFVTFLDQGIVVRANMNTAGVFIVLDPAASVDAVQETIQHTLRGEL